MDRLTRQVLGIHTGALGDVILFGHCLERRRAPDTSIALAAGGEKARLLAALGVVDEAIDVERLALHEVFALQSDLSELAEQLGRCDHLISCFAANDATAQRRLVPACGASRADFLPVRPKPDDHRHLLDVWSSRMGLNDRRPVRVNCWSAPPDVRAAGIARLQACGMLPGEPFVAMHVGAGSPAKCWPTERFAELADALDRPTVFLAGPVERERWRPKRLNALCGAGILMDSLSLMELTGVLASATAFVGNDSGPGHLAAALGVPVVALFGPTDPVHFAPVAHDNGVLAVLRAIPPSWPSVNCVATALMDLLAPTDAAR